MGGGTEDFNMKRFLFLFLAAGLVLSLAACGAVVDYDTPKSEELSAAYDFYRDSQSSLASGLKAIVSS